VHYLCTAPHQKQGCRTTTLSKSFRALLEAADSSVDSNHVLTFAEQTHAANLNKGHKLIHPVSLDFEKPKNQKITK